MTMAGEHRGHVELSTLWVHVDTATMAPAPLTDHFMATYAPAAGGRKVSSRLWLGDPPVGAAAEPWRLRAVDIDLLGHVNNAAYWAAVEEQIEPGTVFAHGLLARPHRAVIEYGPGIPAGSQVELLLDESVDHLAVWFTVGAAVLAAATVVPLPGGCREVCRSHRGYPRLRRQRLQSPPRARPAGRRARRHAGTLTMAANGQRHDDGHGGHRPAGTATGGRSPPSMSPHSASPSGTPAPTASRHAPIWDTTSVATLWRGVAPRARRWRRRRAPSRAANDATTGR